MIASGRYQRVTLPTILNMLKESSVVLYLCQDDLHVNHMFSSKMQFEIVKEEDIEFAIEEWKKYSYYDYQFAIWVERD